MHLWHHQLCWRGTAGNWVEFLPCILQGTADRVLLGLLPSSECAWKTAVAALKDTGGCLHLHGNVKDTEEASWAQATLVSTHAPCKLVMAIAECAAGLTMCTRMCLLHTGCNHLSQYSLAFEPEATYKLRSQYSAG